MRFCTLLILFFAVSLYCKAVGDTLTSKEKQELRDALMQTPLGANFQASMYSQKGNGIKAGEYLIKSDPHSRLWFKS